MPLVCTVSHQALLTVLLGRAGGLQRYYCFWVALLLVAQPEAPQQEIGFWEAESSCLRKLAARPGGCPSFLDTCMSHPLPALRTLGRASQGDGLRDVQGQLSLCPNPEASQTLNGSRRVPVLASIGVAVPTCQTLTCSPDSKGECR